MHHRITLFARLLRCCGGDECLLARECVAVVHTAKHVTLPSVKRIIISLPCAVLQCIVKASCTQRDQHQHTPCARGLTTLHSRRRQGNESIHHVLTGKSNALVVASLDTLQTRNTLAIPRSARDRQRERERERGQCQIVPSTTRSQLDEHYTLASIARSLRCDARYKYKIRRHGENRKKSRPVL